MVDLAKTLLQTFEVELAGSGRVELDPEVLDPRIALILGLLEAMLNLGNQLGRAHSGGMSRRSDGRSFRGDSLRRWGGEGWSVIAIETTS